jgi:hypothetical protein
VDDHPEAIALFNRLDPHAALRNGLRRVAADRGDYSGIPMPLDGRRLVIEPTWPKAKELSAIGAPDEEPEATVKLRNRFHDPKGRGEVAIFEENGRVDWGLNAGVNHFLMDINTMDCVAAWGIEQESRAVHLLGGLVTHHQFKQYLLTGMFVEESKRSGVFYFFRRLKPTVALRAGDGKDSARILACLCLHPIGYYAGTWAGAMCPTDDVVAHLMMMRGDEVMYWKRSNQIAAWRPEAGL